MAGTLRASMTPLLVSIVILGGLFLLVNQKVDIPFLYRAVQASSP